MARRALARLAVAGTVMAGVVGGVAAPAWAPKYILASFAFGECLLDDGTTGHLTGDFTVESFQNADGKLQVNGMLTGACIDAGTRVATIDPGVYTFAVVDVRAECRDDFAGLDLRPGAGRVGGVLGEKGDAVKMTVDLYPSTVVERDWRPGDAMSVRGRLCALARMVAQRDPAELAGILNQLVLRV